MIEVGARSAEPKAGVDHWGDDAHVVPDFEGARGDSDGAAVGERGGELIDDLTDDAVAGELAMVRPTGPAPTTRTSAIAFVMMTDSVNERIFRIDEEVLDPHCRRP